MIDAKSLDVILRSARTHNGFLDKPVTEEQLRAIYEIMKWGPTSSNSQPVRIVWVRKVLTHAVEFDREGELS